MPDDPELAAICARFRIRRDDAFLVLALLERPESRWPACCGTGCDPCMEDVAEAARALRAARRR